MKKLFLLFFLLVNLSAHAVLTKEPCRFGVVAELLYFKVTDEQPNFALTSQDSVFHIEGNHPKLKPGFRLEGIWKILPCGDLNFRFTYFDPGKHDRNIVGEFVAPEFSGQIKSALDIRYYSLEALFGKWLIKCPDFQLQMQGGLLYSNLKSFESKETIPIESPPLHLIVARHSDFWGIGPELVLDLEYPLPLAAQGKFALLANVRGALLASETKKKLSSTDPAPPPVTFTFDSNPIWRVTPVLDVRVGMGWNTFLCDCRSYVEVGYEWIWLRQAVSKFNPDFFNTTYSNISFQGPYAAIGIAF